VKPRRTVCGPARSPTISPTGRRISGFHQISEILPGEGRENVVWAMPTEISSKLTSVYAPPRRAIQGEVMREGSDQVGCRDRCAAVFKAREWNGRRKSTAAVDPNDLGVSGRFETLERMTFSSNRHLPSLAFFGWINDLFPKNRYPPPFGKPRGPAFRDHALS